MNNNNENISPTKQEPCPDNNMALAIASTIATFFGCFIFGSIFGVMAIVYASKVSSYWNGGFHDEAKRYASKAKKWAIIGLAILILYWLIVIISIISSSYQKSNFY